MLKKHLLCMTLALTLCVGLHANPITREQARQRAVEFLQNQPGSRHLKPVTSGARLSPRRLAPGQLVAPSTPDLYYVFDRGDEQGYVLVSGDDSTLPVLGYTDAGHFDYAQLPPNMKFWLEGYENELAALRSAAASTAAASSTASGGEAPRVGADVPVHDPIAILCTSRWSQGDPYNQSCPMYFNLGRSVTGCVATAMAQILYYHRDKSVDETQAAMPGYEAWAEKPYNGQYLQVEGVPAESPIDWDNMIDNYGGSATAKQKKAVADLMLYCGVSVKMGYTNQSSGAQSYEVANALPKYFGYGSSVKYISFSNYTETSWDAAIYNELKNARPVYLSGANTEGGHAFVCDGYDGNRCYHINWGWGGMSDGYFLLNSLNPASQGIGGTGDGYNTYRDAVIGIEPVFYAAKAISFSDATAKRLAVAAWDADGDGKLTFGEAAEVTDLGDVFKGQRIKTLQELYHFTSLRTLTADAFSGCTTLTSVKLPKSLTTIGDRAFQGCTALKTLRLPDGIEALGTEAFDGCTALTGLELPAGFTTIGARAFQGCTALSAITLPFSLATVGDGAFQGCTKLATVEVATTMPAGIRLGEGVFSGVDMAAATLKVRQGTRAYFAEAAQWSDFGTLREQRDRSRSTFATLEAEKTYYLYNVGTGLYLTRGEAWGTQAIVGEEPMRFTLKHTASMADGVYALYSDDTGSSRHYTFRTTTDGNVGQGVAAAFVDGSIGTTAFWQFAEVQPGVYTIQIPQGLNDFVSADRYWGVQTDHESNAAAPTYGVYSDISLADNPLGCQWRLVEYDADYATLYAAAESLQQLINRAVKAKVITTREQAVYDDMQSSLQDILAAQDRLRRRLGIISFNDDVVRATALERWDIDSDGELTEAEAAGVTDLETVFAGSAVKDLSDLKYFTGVTRLANNAVQNSKQLQRVVLPSSLNTLGYRVFKNCTALESVELGAQLTTIGVSCFESCTALKDVRLHATDPSAIRVPASAFKNVNLEAATLWVPFGCREAYAAADVWSSFGTIREMRSQAMPAFSPVATGVDGYILNLGSGRYIAPGEAYGTQAVVAQQGIVYQFKRSNSMAANTYYLSSDQTGQTNKILFRTSTDTNVGEGVKTCFVDGTVSSKAYWTIQQAEDMTFTMQVPQKDATYVEDEFLGVDTNHESKAASPTYGLYWDVSIDTDERACRWAFVTVEDMQKAEQMNLVAEKLQRLLAKAAARQLDAAAEQAVYDDAAATTADLTAAVTSLQHKLHFIDFQSDRARELCVALWDADDDDELSIEEAAAVTDIAETFRAQTAIKSLEELRYFTSLTEIPANAFRGCSGIQSIYVPAGVKSIGADAFATMSQLKYVAVLTDAVLPAADANLPRQIAIFVPAAQMQGYADDATWGTRTILEYTGVPTVTAADQQRVYGRANSRLTFEVTGAPINGEPAVSCLADATTPVGEHPITVLPGTITSEGLVCVNGTLTVEPAELTVTAKSYTRNFHEENPVFEVTYKGLKNREKAEDILITPPTVECDATADSQPGTYEIRVFGAEAQNYVFVYEPGTLTILDVDAVRSISTAAQPATIHDLTGRKVQRTTRRGVYVVDGQKVVR